MGALQGAYINSGRVEILDVVLFENLEKLRAVAFALAAEAAGSKDDFDGWVGHFFLVVVESRVEEMG